MRQVDSVCAEKTCLSYMCDTSICNQHMKSVVLLVTMLSLISTFE